MVKDVASVIAFVSLVIFIPAAIVSAIALRRVFVYLQKSHPAIWQQLGHPSIWRGQWSATSPASKFITQQTIAARKIPRYGGCASVHASCPTLLSHCS